MKRCLIFYYPFFFAFILLFLLYSSSKSSESADDDIKRLVSLLKDSLTFLMNTFDDKTAPGIFDIIGRFFPFSMDKFQTVSERNLTLKSGDSNVQSYRNFYAGQSVLVSFVSILKKEKYAGTLADILDQQARFDYETFPLNETEMWGILKTLRVV